MNSYTLRLINMAGALLEEQLRSTSNVDPAEIEPLEPLVELRSFSGALEGWSPWYIDYETVVPGDAAFFSLYVRSAEEEHLMCTVGLFARNVNPQIMDIFEETVEKTRRALVDSKVDVGDEPELEPSNFPAILQMLYVSDLPVVPTEAAMLIAEQVACAFWLTVDDETTEFH